MVYPCVYTIIYTYHKNKLYRPAPRLSRRFSFRKNAYLGNILITSDSQLVLTAFTDKIMFHAKTIRLSVDLSSDVQCVNYLKYISCCQLKYR